MINNVLVTAIGSFAADVVIRNLKKQGCFVVGCDIYPKEWVAQSLDVDVFVQAEYATKEDAYLEFLLKTCKQYKIQMVLPLTDVEVDVLNKYREHLEAEGIKTAMSGTETIHLCRNKYESERFLRETKVCKTIPTMLLRDISAEHITFPVVVKPVDGRSSQGLRRIRSQRELKLVMEEEELKDSSGYILQPMIEGSIITVDVVRQPDTETVVCLPRKELLRTLNGAGTSVYVFRSEELEARCRTIADALNVKGCVNFEFVEDGNGQYHFLECNPRFSGGVAFSCLAGYNMVENHLRCFGGEAMEGQCLVKEQYIARKYDEYVTDKESV